MTAHSKLWHLERFRMEDALTEAQKRALESTTRLLEVPRGHPIYLPGDASDDVFLLKAGVVKISVGGPEGSNAILAFLYPGDIFGEQAILDDTPRDHVATAHEDAVLCALNRDTLRQVMQQSPALGYHVTTLMSLRLRRCRLRVEKLLYKSAPARIAHTLLDLATDYGVPDDAGVVIPLRLNQSDLGNFVGLARETVNIVLQDFRQRGLIDTDRKSIRINDPEQLRRIS